MQLVGQAYDNGYGERRDFSAPGLRDLRERLSLAAASAGLDRWVDEVYRATLDSRNVPQIGLELSEERHRDVGSGTRILRHRSFVPGEHPQTGFTGFRGHRDPDRHGHAVDYRRWSNFGH